MTDAAPADHLERLGSTELIENVCQSPSVTPSSKPLPVEDNFARLVPVNTSAKRAFHEVALRLSENPDTFAHHQKFICVDKPAPQLQLDASPLTGRVDDASKTDAAPLLTGCFCLCLNVLPGSIARGWVIGSGRPQRPGMGIDLRISIDAIRDDVSGRHARLFHHPSSGVLMLAANPGKTVIVNGEELANDNKRVLSVASMGIIFGNLAYRFEFVLPNSSMYRKQLRTLLQRSEAWSAYQESFDPTPSENHFELRGYQFQTPSFYGTYGVVSACIKTSTGSLYAVKRIQRTERLRRLIENELGVLRKLDYHPHTCSLVDVFYSNGDAFSMGSRSVNDVYVILEPWAPSSFRALIPPVGDLSYQKSAFHQGAQGIRYLHSRGIMHRDIKPSNLLLASRDPLRVVIADFGHATAERGSKDHNKGTIAYLPPEIMALKGRSLAPLPGIDLHGWTLASDVFMYGLVGLEILGVIDHGVRIDIHSLNLPILARALSRSNDPWRQTLAQMVAIDPRARPDMRHLLLKSIWTDPETPADNLRKRPNGAVG